MNDDLMYGWVLLNDHPEVVSVHDPDAPAVFHISNKDCNSAADALPVTLWQYEDEIYVNASARDVASYMEDWALAHKKVAFLLPVASGATWHIQVYWVPKEVQRDGARRVIHLWPFYVLIPVGGVAPQSYEYWEKTERPRPEPGMTPLLGIVVDSVSSERCALRLSGATDIGRLLILRTREYLARRYPECALGEVDLIRPRESRGTVRYGTPGRRSNPLYDEAYRKMTDEGLTQAQAVDWLMNKVPPLGNFDFGRRDRFSKAIRRRTKPTK
ncbi:MAG: hypothetical protein M1140_07465 [Chloroflexi bacterium]|nr:hypothetical protein [Chloroflexota bacterium]